MPEYHALRVLLAILQAVLFHRIIHARAVYLLVFALYMYAEAVANLIPALTYSGAWWRRIWLPMAIVRLVVATAASLDLFTFIRARTYAKERQMLLLWSGLVGAMLSLAGWAWFPANWFQALSTVRQYLILILFAGTLAAWVYIWILRPVQLWDFDATGGYLAPGLKTEPRGPLYRHGWMWCAWLLVAFTMSTTGASGLTWLVFDRRGSQWIWRAINDGCLGIQIALVCWWVLSLRQKRGAARDLSVFPQCFQAADPSLHGTVRILPVTPNLHRLTAERPSSCDQITI